MYISNIYTACFSLALFIILLIIGKKSATRADYILIVWLFIFLLNILAFLILDHIGRRYPNNLAARILVEFTDASVFLHGPVFWFYALALSQPGFTFRNKHLLHFILFLVCFIYLTIGAINGDGRLYPIRQWLLIPKMLSILIYVLAIIIQLRRHAQRIENIFSNTEKRNLRWLSYLSKGILIVWLISVLSLILLNLTNGERPVYLILLPNMSICLFIYYMGFFGVRQNTIFSEREVTKYFPAQTELSIDLLAETIPISERKYKKSGLTIEKQEAIHSQLIKYMDAQKLYLNQDISLFDLAEAIHVPSNHLSQVINVKENSNFFDFINGYRVRAVKDQIVAGKLKEHTLLGIALDCGFNSKASFNRAFKKYTGITPTAFNAQR